MKALLQSVTLFILLQMMPTGSTQLNWLQTYLFSTDQTLTHFGSLEFDDIQIISIYNDSRHLTFKESWSKANQTEYYWDTFRVFLLKYLSSFRLHIKEIHEQIGNTDPVTVQCWISCPSFMNSRGLIFRVGIDGEDLLHLNAEEKVWVAGRSPYSQPVQKLMEKATVTLQNIEIHVNTVCRSLSQIFSIAGKEALSQKIQPQAYITSHSFESGTEVICMVTGFYPKPINVTLWKENKTEDVMSTETLPNGDGTYQIKVMMNINITEQQYVYCQVEHSSLKEMLIVQLDVKQHTPVGLVVTMSILFIFCVIAVVCFVKSYRKC